MTTESAILMPIEGNIQSLSAESTPQLVFTTPNRQIFKNCDVVFQGFELNRSSLRLNEVLYLLLNNLAASVFAVFLRW